MTDDQRHEPRYDCQLTARLWRGKRSLDVTTKNVSFNGLFVRMAAPPAVRELVEIEVLLPPDDRPLLLRGMVAHAIRRGRDAEGVPGIGVELRALSLEARATWDKFVRQLQARAASAQTGEAARRQTLRDGPTLSVREEDVSEETIDIWESEEPTEVKPQPTARKR